MRYESKQVGTRKSLGVALLLAGAAATAARAPALARQAEVVSYEVSTGRPTLPHVETVVAVHPTRPNRLAVAAIAIEAPHDDRFHDSWRVVVFVSSDGGANWATRSLPRTPAGPAMGDPYLAWAPDGSLYLTALVQHPDRNLRTWLWLSRDEGASWTAHQIPAAEGSQDHPVLDLAGSGESPAVAVFTTIAQVGISGSVRRSGSAAFVPTVLYSPNQENNNLGAGLGLLSGHLLFSYFSMSRPMPTPLWAVRSPDGGQTWTGARITDRHVPVGFPMLAEDRSLGPRRGRVYSVWVSDEETGTVMLGHSDDGGVSWSRPVVIHHGRSQVLRARPAVHVNRHGVVAASWTDGRDDATGRGAWCWDVYAGVSVDGGESFQQEIRLTGSATCSQTPGNGQAGRRWRWGGDYAGIGSDSLGRFYVSWSDSRSGVFQPYLARVTANSGSEPKSK